MTGEESVFSCVKRQDIPAEAARRAPPAAPPPPAQQQQSDSLDVKIADFDIKLKELEAASLTSATSGRKVEHLEKTIAELGGILEGYRLKNQDEKDAFIPYLEQLRKDISAVCYRLAAVEGSGQRFAAADLTGISVNVNLFERRLKKLETGISSELAERFSALDSAFGETSRKAGLAHETAFGNARRVDKVEERVARLAYVESRMISIEGKLERINECDALVQALRVSVEGMEKNVNFVLHEAAGISGEQNRIGSDFESLSRQVKQLTALFNHFRRELAFLIPKKQESGGQ